jgi:pimeloyl-ACP methyl ester carboxylesterase
MATGMGRDAFIQQTAICRDDGHQTLNCIKCPTLVIWSRYDRLRSEEEALELVHSIPNSSYKIIEDSGHMLPLEQPEQLTRVISDWLNHH